jgi:phosphate transport system protein
MVRENFQHSLRELQDMILEQGSMVDTALHHAVTALKTRDHNLARSVIRDDKKINQMRFSIEEKALSLIALQQPVARDLRMIATAFVMAMELERMGDHAKGIARISQLLNGHLTTKPQLEIAQMAEICNNMLNAALDAYLKDDLAAAENIPGRDDEVDNLFDSISAELLMMMSNDSSTNTEATYLIWAAHNLERFADRVVNICERVVYNITGELAEVEDFGHDELPETPSARLELEA